MTFFFFALYLTLGGTADVLCVSFALLQIKTFFCLLNIIFQNSQNFFKRNACEITIFSLICRKNGKTHAKFVKTT